MDLGWGNPKASKFVTNVGLITSNGPNGQNIMAAEWTYYVSYSPALISVHIGGGNSPSGKATTENIKASKEFGVNIASQEQNVFSSIAGGSSGREIDKVGMLKEMGAQFYNGKKIKAPMLSGCCTNAECKVIEIKEVGDHIMLIGEVVEIESDLAKLPLVYSGNKYWKLGEHIGKPEQSVLDKIEALKLKYAKKK
jgi:flavin reductase (DIM6/NTAB) family NADH-FMN oxidoreductase RutF